MPLKGRSGLGRGASNPDAGTTSGQDPGSARTARASAATLTIGHIQARPPSALAQRDRPAHRVHGDVGPATAARELELLLRSVAAGAGGGRPERVVDGAAERRDREGG